MRVTSTTQRGRTYAIAASLAAVCIFLGWITFGPRSSSRAAGRTAPAVGNSAAAASAASAAGVAVPQPRSDPEDQLAKDLLGANTAARKNAVALINQKMQNSAPATAKLFATRWVEPLLKSGQYDEVVQWSKVVSVIVPDEPLDMPSMESVLRCRALALLRAGKPAEALVAAKTGYNFNRIAKTPAAVELIIQCLAADPQTSSLIPKFRMEQSAGASVRSLLEPWTASTVLKSIKVDAEPYEKIVREIDSKAASLRNMDYYRSLIQRGNRLLMADQGARARKYFDEAYEICRGGHPRWFDDRQLSSAVESVARALRAEDGAVGRAKAFLDQNRVTPTPKRR
jgi:hypothetical protein